MKYIRLLGAASVMVVASACATTTGPAPMVGHLLMSTTDAPLEAITGELRDRQVVAIHQVQASHAIVLEDAVAGQPQGLEPGDVLAAVALDSTRTATELPPKADAVLWCHIGEIGIFSASGALCLQDSDGDGFLDRRFGASFASPQVPLTMNRFRLLPEETGLPLRVAYREASADELPVARVGYEACAVRSDNAPPQFSFVIYSRTWHNGYEGCRIGQWPDVEDRSRVRIGPGLELNLTREGNDTFYEVDGRLPIEPVRFPRAGSEPIWLGESAGQTSGGMAGLRDLMAGALVVQGEPTIVEGRVMTEQPFLTEAVEYGRTGRLANRLGRGGYFGVEIDALEAGTPVYAAPLLDYSDMLAALNGERVDVTWCAPVNRSDNPEQPRWEAVCLPFGAGAYRWVESPSAFFVSGLRFSSDSSRTERPVVVEQPVDFGVEIERQIIFRRWRNNQVELQISIGPESGVDSSSRQRIRRPRLDDGAVLLEMYGHRFRLTQPDPNDPLRAEVEYLEPEGGTLAIGIDPKPEAPAESAGSR